jgi:hypothetical protein
MMALCTEMNDVPTASVESVCFLSIKMEWSTTTSPTQSKEVSVEAEGQKKASFERAVEMTRFSLCRTPLLSLPSEREKGPMGEGK